MRIYFLGEREYSFRNTGKNAREREQEWREIDTEQMPLRARRRAENFGILPYPTETIGEFIRSVKGRGVYFIPASWLAAIAVHDLGMKKIVRGPFIVYRPI